MTAYTKTKINRLFEEIDYKIVKREKPVPEELRFGKICRGCKGPMMVSEDQVANYHKDCRKKSRHGFTFSK